RAAFTAHTRGGWRAVGRDDAGVLVPGGGAGAPPGGAPPPRGPPPRLPEPPEGPLTPS
ncbi:amidohydrolase, partial [Streptomyces turgidiscabies]